MTLTEELVRALRAVLAEEMIYTGATETTLEQSGYYPNLMAQINAALSRYEAEKDATGDVVEALRAAEDALASSYQVVDYPANGTSTQDAALAKVRAAIARAAIAAMPPQLPPEIEALRELSAKATQGELRAEPWGDGSSPELRNLIAPDVETVLAADLLPEDADFIAAAVNAVRKLLERDNG